MRPDLTPIRQCRKCRRDLPLEAFDTVFRNGRPNGLHERCRECRARIGRERQPQRPVNMSGLCRCGCGEPTAIARMSAYKYGIVKGMPLHYVSGHQQRKSPVAYVVEDRGFTTPCWIWQRATSRHGYGCTTVKYRRLPAHVVYYEARFGRVPDGLEIDHLCRVKACVNPDHLEAVTHQENVRRAKRR